MKATKAVAGALAVAFAVQLSGCATQPSNVQAAYVSTMKYDTYDCRRLMREAEEVDIRLRQTTGTLQTKATTDAVLMTVGLIVFWPALLALPATGGKPEELELAKLKGEADALIRALKEKDCDVPRPVEAKIVPAGIQPASLTVTSPAKGLPESPRTVVAPIAPEPAPAIVKVVAPAAVAAPQPTNNLALAATTAQSGGCKLSGDVKMVSQTLDVSKFEVPCRGNEKPMKIICRNDDCKRDWIQAYP
jgi:hypothetical protein